MLFFILMNPKYKNIVFSAIGIVLALLFIVLMFQIANLVLKQAHGLGEPLIHESNKLFGYRPRPNQEVQRQRGAVIRTNNIGLRNNDDWDADPADKILFLGDSVTYGGSYIDNDQLFTTILDKSIPNKQVGNSGVNGWGVENVYGLVVDAGFQPASCYVIFLTEGDFYRGLANTYGWRKKPKSPIRELLVHYLSLWIHQQKYRVRKNADAKPILADLAAKKLARMERLLKSKSYRQLVVITPTKLQAYNDDPVDPMVKAALYNNDVKVTYLKDAIRKQVQDHNLSSESLYFDNAHLEVDGHKLWSTVLQPIVEKDCR